MKINLKIFFCLIIFFIITNSINADDNPGFFLKVTKNVPRLGRRSDNNFDEYYRKVIKNIPRVGKREMNVSFI